MKKAACWPVPLPISSTRWRSPIHGSSAAAIGSRLRSQASEYGLLDIETASRRGRLHCARGGYCSAGLRPAPAEAGAGATAEATANAGFLWDGGLGPVAGDAVNPSLGAWPRHPCRGHPRHRPPPAFDSFPRSAGTALGVRSVFLRKTDLTPDLFRYLTDVSTKVDTYQQPRRSVRGGAVWGVSRMDAAAKPPGTDSRRPRTPTPRRPPTESPLLTLTLLLRLPASGRHYSRCRAASPAETLPDHDCSHLPECPPLAKVEELT
ncbi:hypothetical protein BN126310113 [Stenotrophomonas indicatrix]|nr:hypothetical protein BN126310113 [Stenotrophomonas indicatrix]